MPLTRRQMLRAAGLWASSPALKRLPQGCLGLFAPSRLPASPRLAPPKAKTYHGES
jgi:hypothetical protein